MKAKRDQLLSNFTFNLKLRHYSTARARVGAGGALTLAMPALCSGGTAGTPQASHVQDLEAAEGSSFDNTERTLALAAITRRAAALAPRAMVGRCKFNPGRKHLTHAWFQGVSALDTKT